MEPAAPSSRGLRSTAPLLTSGQEALGQLLTDHDALAAWALDPRGFARARLGRSPCARWIAGLDRTGVVEAAGVLSRKAAKAPSATPTEADGGRTVPPSTGRGRDEGPMLAPPPRDRGARREPGAWSPAVGCAYRPALIPSLFEELQGIDVWEHIADWYMGEGGARRLARFAGATPVTLHCLTLSIGSEAGASSGERSQALAPLVAASGVDHVSDHLAFSRTGTTTLPHFVPLWRVEEQLDLVVENVDRIQSELGIPLLLENPASPLDPGGDMSSAQFLNELCARAGCEVLLDLENLRVNEANGLVDAERELKELDLGTVGGIHLAGGTDPDAQDPAFDAHAWPVRDVVLGWLGQVLPDAPRCRWVVLERDGRLEDGAEVVEDLHRLRRVLGPGAP